MERPTGGVVSAHSRVPTLFAMVGLPAVGKTYRARQIAASVGAIRLTKDEWMLPLYGNLDDSPRQDVVEGRLVWLAMRALAVGTSVVLDFGLWSQVERSALRHLALDAGAQFELVYLEADVAEQRRRRDRRERVTPELTVLIDDGVLAQYASRFEVPTADELNGTALDPPPPGFVSWLAWTAERWPTSMQD